MSYRKSRHSEKLGLIFEERLFWVDSVRLVGLLGQLWPSVERTPLLVSWPLAFRGQCGRALLPAGHYCKP